MTVIHETPIFYDPANVPLSTYRPDAGTIAAEAETWRERHDIRPSTDDRLRIEILAIDMQNDFCTPDGALFVGGRSGRGAVEDTRRSVEFIYRNLGMITRITPTMDSHIPYQIFFASFWRDNNGNRPAPFTEITADDIRKERFTIDPAVAHLAADRPDYAWARRQAQFYADELERNGKYRLTLWPYHCIVGDAGHALTPTLQEARLFHSLVRQTQSEIEIKGDNPWTENYSVFGAEVRDRWDGKAPLAEKNLGLVRRLIDNDAIVFIGEAASHCFMWSVDDLMTEIRSIDPDLVRKIYVVMDCTSSVVIFDDAGTPIVDFTDETQAAFDRWRAEGVNIVRSTDDIETWPGLSL